MARIPAQINPKPNLEVGRGQQRLLHRQQQATLNPMPHLLLGGSYSITKGRATREDSLTQLLREERTRCG